ncbi:MAG: hypothetical protein ACPL07_02810 [Candidatus Bathyarchaeia archaeon]
MVYWLPQYLHDHEALWGAFADKLFQLFRNILLALRVLALLHLLYALCVEEDAHQPLLELLEEWRTATPPELNTPIE